MTPVTSFDVYRYIVGVKSESQAISAWISSLHLWVVSGDVVCHMYEDTFYSVLFDSDI